MGEVTALQDLANLIYFGSNVNRPICDELYRILGFAQDGLSKEGRPVIAFSVLQRTKWY